VPSSAVFSLIFMTTFVVWFSSSMEVQKSVRFVLRVVRLMSHNRTRPLCDCSMYLCV